ncbi:oxidoreductase [Streptomyces sp. NPDC055025]
MIPLAPLGLGDILGGTFATMGRYWKPLFGLAALVYGAATLVVVAALAVAYAEVGDHLHRVFDTAFETDPSWHDLRPLLIAFGCVWVLGTLALLAANALVQAACPAMVQNAVLGRRTTLRETWRRASVRTPAVLGTSVLSWLIALVPLGLFVAAFTATLISLTTPGEWRPASWLIPAGFLGTLVVAPPAIWLWVRFSLAPAVAMIESRGPLAAMSRSAHLVRGAWWRIFGISLLAFAMAALAGLVFQQFVGALGVFPGVFDTADDNGDLTAGLALVALVGYLALSLIGQLVSQIAVTVFPQLVLGLLYVDQRIRTENLAPTLAEAAATTTPPP